MATGLGDNVAVTRCQIGASNSETGPVLRTGAIDENMRGGVACSILAQAAMRSCDTSVAELVAELRIKPVTPYRYVGTKRELRENGKHVLNA